MNWYKQVHKLQIDLTSHCNARCGACVRNVNGNEIKPGLELKHFDLDLWKRVTTEDTKGWYISHLSLNGNWGDAVMHPDLLEIVKIWTKHHPESMIAIATNGSLRDKKFWIELAKALRFASHHKIDFAMDGMEDTHHLYRRKTSHTKLTENIKSFTDAGGIVKILMTMFEHNKHQVEEVKELSRKLGAREFKARPSFTGERELHIQDGKDDYKIKGYYPEIEQKTYRFPENEKISSDLKDGNIYMETNSRINESNKIHIESKCPWKQAGEIQIDPWGIVWPCCYISKFGGGGSMKDANMDKVFAPGNDNLINIAFNENNLNLYTLKEVLKNKWFNTTVDNAVENANWQICDSNCGIGKKHELV